MKRFLHLLQLFFCWANLKRLVYLIVFSPVSLLAKLIPKTDIVVIGARYGKFYDWDPKYLLEHLLKHPDEVDFKFYWVARTRALWRALRDQGKPVLLVYRPRDMWRILRARIAVISTSPGDIDLHLISGAKLVHTYHGIPLLKVANGYLEWRARGLMSGWKGWVIRLCFRIYYAVRVEAKADYIITTSKWINGIWQSQYNHDPSMYRVLGMPRNDPLFQECQPRIRCEPTEKIISYLPTFRGHPGLSNKTLMDLLKPYGFDPMTFDNFLKRNNARLLVKCHHRQHGSEELQAYLKPFDRISLYQGQDAIPLLRETDILISDYSSVSFPYLMLDRPLVLAPFDFEEYRDVRGMALDYETFMPGPICRDWPQVLASLDRCQAEDRYREKRANARDLLFEHQDGNSCQRVVRFLNALNHELAGRTAPSDEDVETSKDARCYSRTTALNDR